MINTLAQNKLHEKSNHQINKKINKHSNDLSASFRDTFLFKLEVCLENL